jgi:hypothetical protein
MLAHNTEAALVAAVALVSSALEPDTMVAPADLDAFVRIDGYTTGDGLHPVVGERSRTQRSGHRVELLESVRGLKKITRWPPSIV